jgi:hypothetical protein
VGRHADPARGLPAGHAARPDPGRRRGPLRPPPLRRHRRPSARRRLHRPRARLELHADLRPRAAGRPGHRPLQARDPRRPAQHGGGGHAACRHVALRGDQRPWPHPRARARRRAAAGGGTVHRDACERSNLRPLGAACERHRVRRSRHQPGCGGACGTLLTARGRPRRTGDHHVAAPASHAADRIVDRGPVGWHDQRRRVPARQVHPARRQSRLLGPRRDLGRGDRGGLAAGHRGRQLEHPQAPLPARPARDGREHPRRGARPAVRRRRRRVRRDRLRQRPGRRARAAAGAAHRPGAGPRPGVRCQGDADLRRIRPVVPARRGVRVPVRAACPVPGGRRRSALRVGVVRLRPAQRLERAAGARGGARARRRRGARLGH